MVKVGPSPLSTSLQAVVNRSASSLMDVNLDPKVASGSSTVLDLVQPASAWWALANSATKNAKDFMVLVGCA